jgi:hypothetical protein
MVQTSSTAAGFRFRSPLLWIGLAGVALCEALPFFDAFGCSAGTAWYLIVRFVRASMTPSAWCFYLLMLLGFLRGLDDHSWLRRYRNRFAVCWLWSVTAWCYFDAMNFYFIVDGGQTSRLPCLRTQERDRRAARGRH